MGTRARTYGDSTTAHARLIALKEMLGAPLAVSMREGGLGEVAASLTSGKRTAGATLCVEVPLEGGGRFLVLATVCPEGTNNGAIRETGAGLDFQEGTAVVEGQRGVFRKGAKRPD